MYRTAILILLLTGALWGDARVVLDDFAKSKEGALPAGWRYFPFQGKKARQVYHVRAEGENRFLAAQDSQNISVQIYKKMYWNLNDHPKLTWRWRARQLPGGANETDPAKNDAACGVYLLFSQYDREAIKYTWSSSAPSGTVHQKPGHNFFFIIKDSGARKLNQWVTHTVDVRADYQRLFKGSALKPVIGIGVLTDGNAVGKPAACDYDEFVKHN